jgi:1-deoxy-D-xylulose-5-phosphate reductoisomerase
VGGTAPLAMNAANEIAVESFLSGSIRFTAIAGVIEGTLERFCNERAQDLADYMAIDEEARAFARQTIHSFDGAC